MSKQGKKKGGRKGKEMVGKKRRQITPGSEHQRVFLTPRGLVAQANPQHFSAQNSQSTLHRHTFIIRIRIIYMYI